MSAGKMDGAALIAAERRRQVEVEGWTPEHDDEHADGELARAAGCYALSAGLPDMVRDYHRRNLGVDPHSLPAPWPWEPQWWKPGADNSPASRVRELVKAGALIVAEIDRLQRRGQS